MKTFRGLISTLLACLVTAGTLFADDPSTIIPEDDVSIQFFPTSDFADWPGVSGISPIELSAAAGRVWLVWPGSIINLNGSGAVDEQTLLTLFASRDALWGDDEWSAQSGVICSDGFWRGFIDLPHLFAQLDLFSGIVSTRNWEGELPDSIYPASDGNLLIFTGDKAELADFNNGIQELGNGIPPLSMLAVSTTEPIAAWQEGGSSSIHIAGFERIDSPNSKMEIPGVPWSMSWAGKMLVIAYPGKLYALEMEGHPAVYRLENERLPDRWYRIRGGKNNLVIQSPEEGTAGILSLAKENLPLSGEVREDFVSLLKKYTLTAGDKLEEAGFGSQADHYYRWVMPYIREYRSRYPLEEIWPNLESEITRRRSALR
ncbi:MAG: hypothetical protein DRP70_12715 [Spirochaetes bacterium]|nr:MAG: hypothetical protein DRP70_12715 [Spirochaetota bacterium]RKX97077.1 MAG: hypothetical protein DRZ90_07415 [Spirochaetota bacterium]